MSASFNKTEPATDAVAITPSDESDLAIIPRGIYVGGAGDVTVDMVGVGTNITFSSLLAGSILPIRPSKVYSTGTTATNLIGLN